MLPFIHSLWTIVVMITFLSIVAWAYSSKRNAEFEEAARLPLEDDDPMEINLQEKHHV